MTNLTIYEKVGENSAFTLTKYLVGPSFSSKEARIKEIKESCGWTIAGVLEEIGQPPAHEVAVIALAQPSRAFH